MSELQSFRTLQKMPLYNKKTVSVPWALLLFVDKSYIKSISISFAKLKLEALLFVCFMLPRIQLKTL